MVLSGLEKHRSLKTLYLHMPLQFHAGILPSISTMPRLQIVILGFEIFSLHPPIHADGPSLQRILQCKSTAIIKMLAMDFSAVDTWHAFCEGVAAAAVRGLDFELCWFGDSDLFRQARVGSRLKKLKFLNSWSGLGVSRHDAEETMSRLLTALAHAVPTMPELEELWCHQASSGEAYVDLIQAAAQCQSLECIEIRVDSYPAALDKAFAECLAKYKALEDIEIEHTLVRPPPILTSPALCQALETNYTMWRLKLSYPCIRDDWDPLLRQTLNTYIWLNRSGRRYLATDPGNVRAGIQVLEQVKDNLDCIYCHLRENPALCMRQASPESGHKRTAPSPLNPAPCKSARSS